MIRLRSLLCRTCRHRQVSVPLAVGVDIPQMIVCLRYGVHNGKEDV